jgi:hypothetical protein
MSERDLTLSGLIIVGMPRHSSHIVELAKKGAEHRLAELELEIATLIRNFPHLRASHRRRRTPRIDVSSEPAALIDRPRRNRKPMSAAARKAVSLRMRRYWAGRRKAKNA